MLELAINGASKRITACLRRARDTAHELCLDATAALTRMKDGQVRRRCFLVAALLIGMSACQRVEKNESNSSKTPSMTINGNGGVVVSLAFSPDDSCLASSYDDLPGRSASDSRFVELVLLSSQTGKQLHSIKGTAVLETTFILDGKHVIGSCTDNSVRMWDISTGIELRRFKGHSGQIVHLQSSTKGSLFVTASTDGTAKIWNCKHEDCLLTLQVGGKHGVSSVSISGDEKCVATVAHSHDGMKSELSVWDLSTQVRIQSITHASIMGRALFCKDGKHIASMNRELTRDHMCGLLQVWNVSTGKLLFASDPPEFEVTCIAVSRNGEWIASGAKDGRVTVRESASGKKIHEFLAYENAEQWKNQISAVALSLDGKVLATGSLDGKLKIWRLW